MPRRTAATATTGLPFPTVSDQDESAEGEETPEVPDPETLLTPKQERALACLLTFPSIEAAARAAQVGVTTLYRWKREVPAFREAWQAARRDALQSAGHQLGMLTGEAVETLRGILKSRTVRPEIRVRAAQIVLERAAALWEATDLNDRLMALEAAAEEGQAR